MALDVVAVPALLALALCAAVGAGIGTGHLEGPDSSACTCPSAGGVQISMDAYVSIPFANAEGVSATLPVPSSAAVLLRCDLSDATTQVLTIAWNGWDDNTSTTHPVPPTPPAPVTQPTAPLPPSVPSIVTQPSTTASVPSIVTQPSTTASVPSSPETTTPTTIVTQSEPSTITTGEDTTTMVTESVPSTTTTGEETTTMVTESVPSTTTTGEETTTMATESVPSTTTTGEEASTIVTETAPSTTTTGEGTTTMTTESATSKETSSEPTIQSYPVKARMAEEEILAEETATGTAEETNASAEVTTETVRIEHIRAKRWYHDTDTDNTLTLWIKRDNSTFYLAKVATKFRFKVVPNEFFLVTHSSDVKDWITPLGHTLKCNLETKLGDSVTGMFCIEELQLAAFIAGNCIIPEDVVSCPWTPDATDDNPSTLTGVLIAGIALGAISLAGIFWLGARRLYLSFLTVRAKQQDNVL